MKINYDEELLNEEIAERELDEVTLNSQVYNYVDPLVDKINGLLDKKTTTQTDIARKACLSRKTLSEILSKNYSYDIKFKTILGLSNAVNFSIDEIISNNEHSFNPNRDIRRK